MASLLSARVERAQLVAFAPCGYVQEGFEQHKLTRLLELRAVIDALRCETETQDPLLVWATDGERAQPR